MVETQGLTPKELDLIRRESINVTAIKGREVLRKLIRAGFTEERAREIRAQNEPQFKVYGKPSYTPTMQPSSATVSGELVRSGRGAIESQARIEAAKAAVLPSTTKAQNIPQQFGPYGYEYKTAEGIKYKGTKSFIEQKIQKDFQVQQQREQARQLPSQQVQVQVEVPQQQEQRQEQPIPQRQIGVPPLFGQTKFGKRVAESLVGESRGSKDFINNYQLI